MLLSEASFADLPKSVASLCSQTSVSFDSKKPAMNTLETYNHKFMASGAGDEQAMVLPRGQEDLLPDVPPVDVIDRIDDHMMLVTTNVRNKDSKSLVLSSPLITRRFARRDECRSLTGIVIIMTLCSKVLRDKQTLTPREIFEYFQSQYNEPFFHDQDDCDKSIRETSMLMGVSRRSMGIVASSRSKGH